MLFLFAYLTQLTLENNALVLIAQSKSLATILQVGRGKNFFTKKVVKIDELKKLQGQNFSAQTYIFF